MNFPNLQGLGNPVGTVKRELEEGGFQVLTATPPDRFVVKVPYFGVWAFQSGQVVAATRLIEGAFGLRFRDEPVPTIKAALKEQEVREHPTNGGGLLWKVKTTQSLEAVRAILTREYGRLVATPPSIDEVIAAGLLIGDWTVPNGHRDIPIDGDRAPAAPPRPRTGRARRDALPV